MADIILSGLGWFASSVTGSVIGGVIGVATSMYVKRIDRRAELAKRRYEFAEEVLALFYEAEHAIREIRDAFGRVGEGSSRPRSDDETPQEAEKRNRRYMITERIRLRRETFSSLRAKRFRFQSMFRGEAHKPFDTLEQSVGQIESAYIVLVDLEDSDSTFDPTDAGDVALRASLRNDRMVLRQMVWGCFSGPDEIGNQIRSAIRDVEAIADAAAREYIPAGGRFRRKAGV